MGWLHKPVRLDWYDCATKWPARWVLRLLCSPLARGRRPVPFGAK